MKSLFELDPNTRDHLNRMNAVENYLWEITKMIYPGRFIDPAAVNQIKERLLEHFKSLPQPRRDR